MLRSLSHRHITPSSHRFKMPYPVVSSPLDYAALAREMRAFWVEHDIFRRSVSERPADQSFVFFEGPPSANGTPGIHHVMARTVKDIFCRYQTQLGRRVERKGGWDTHGLPVELQVEKELGITKEDIGKSISVEEYNRRCRETVMRFKGEWDELTEQMGYWVDLENPYITFEAEYIESCWALLKRLYDKGLLYKGYTIQPYSPAAGTGLSSHELNQPGTYRDVKDTTVVAMFRVKHNEQTSRLVINATGIEEAEKVVNNLFILAWTTTPWTLPANTALAVGNGIKYLLVKTLNQYTREEINVILAESLFGRYFHEDRTSNAQEASSRWDDGEALVNGKGLLTKWKIYGEMAGRDLVGLRYEQLFPQVQPENVENAFRVIAADFVTTEDGTGVVHISPTFGADDFRAAQQAGVPALLVKDVDGKPMPIVDRTGKYVPQMGEWAGRYVKNYSGVDDKAFPNLDVDLAVHLKTTGRAFKVEKYEHPYPHCWRTDKPVLYYPLDSWFIRTTAVKERLIELNASINWKPESTGTGRFGNWLENLVDWNLSRSRYWGTPLPIWRTEDGKEEICIGSVAELRAEIARAVAAGVMDHDTLDEHHLAGRAGHQGLDLHRPYVDEIVLISATGRPMRRELDLIDVWFDSGAMPYAQWHYPLENGEKFRQNFPADFIAEGVDQTRGWFFTLHALAVMLEDSVAFKNVIANGLVLDKEGNKMSKRLGNAVDPFATIAQYGPDATRWYMIANAPPWENLKFDAAGIVEVQRRFFGTLLNTYAFFALYANLDGFQVREFDLVPVADRPELDRWILSKLHSLVRETRGHYDAYDPTKAARAIQEFTTDQLSNWYVRLSRGRFRKGDLSPDKKAAFETLHECLMIVGQLMAPIAPFFAEWLYQNMTQHLRAEATERATPLAPESVHLSLLTQPSGELIDVALEARMALAQQVCSLGHALRKKAAIKVRQPLPRLLVPVLTAAAADDLRAVAELIAAELNVKVVEPVGREANLLIKSAKPNFKTVGKRFGPRLKAATAVIQALTRAEIDALEITGIFHVEVEGAAEALTPDDVEIRTEDVPGYASATENGVTVALDLTLTDELRLEGVARELVNRLQNLRKDSGLDVQDRIRVRLANTQPELNRAVAVYGDIVRAEVQAVTLETASDVEATAALAFDTYEVGVQLEIVE